MPTETTAGVGPLPLVLGVTGHKNLRFEDLEPLKQVVREIFRDLRKAYPHTPLVLLSPLAEGADRLVAQVAIEERIALVVPLPWPRAICSERLHRTGSRAEFDQLLRQASHVFALPVFAGCDAAQIQDSDAHRERHYDQVGAYIARHSEILISLWDGIENPDGGTAKVNRWQREGVPAPYARDIGLLDQVENGPVFHIVTPRQQQAVPEGALTLHKRYPIDQATKQEEPRAFHTIWENMESFNRDAVKLTPRLAAKLQQSKNWLIPEADAKALPPHLQFSRDRYAEADALAMYHQTRTLRALNSLFLLAFAAFVLFEFYVGFWPGVPLFLGLYVALLGIGAGIFWYANWRGIYSKYLDRRALAEAMRVQIFWRLAGLRDSAADHYLRNLRSELDWIRVAIRSWNLTSGEHDCLQGPADKDLLTHGLGLTETHWVEDQRKFFNRASLRNERSHQRWHWAERIAFVGAVVLAMVQLAIQPHHHLLVVAIALAIAAAALLHGYADHRAFSVHARRYKWMESLFDGAATKLPQALAKRRLNDAQEMVRELGKEALAENGEWVISHRERPLNIPT